MEEAIPKLHGLGDGTMEYAIYSATEDATNAYWEGLRERVFAIIGDWADQYMWHRQRLHFKLEEKGGRKCLAGVLFFGENGEDEWYVTGLLLKVSAEIDDVLVHVVDSDGQFLLIEAADALPPWMDPEGMDNRIFLRNGYVIAIPPVPENPGQCYALAPILNRGKTQQHNVSDCPHVPLDVALEVVVRSSCLDLRCCEVTDSLKARISGYPSACLQDQKHCVSLRLPTPVAVALTAVPSLLPTAVLTFCERTPDDLRFMKLMPTFSPIRVGISIAPVKMTKLLYAMLSQQQFEPYIAHFGPVPDRAKESSLYRQYMLGAHVASGFEAAYQQAAIVARPRQETRAVSQQFEEKRTGTANGSFSQPSRNQPHMSVQNDPLGKSAPHPPQSGADAAYSAELDRTRQERERKKGISNTNGPVIDGTHGETPCTTNWEEYLAKLTRLGYFGGEVEGSKTWTETSEAAKTFFANIPGSHALSPGNPSPNPVASGTTMQNNDHPCESRPCPLGLCLPWNESFNNCAAPVPYTEDGGLDNYADLTHRSIAHWMSARILTELPRKVSFDEVSDNSDDWLTVDPNETDITLASKFDASLDHKLQLDAADRAAAAKKVQDYELAQKILSDTAEAMTQFVNTKNDYRGVVHDGIPGLSEKRPPASHSTSNTAAEAVSPADEDYLPPEKCDWHFDRAKFESIRRQLLGIEVQTLVHDREEGDSSRSSSSDEDFCDVNLLDALDSEASSASAAKFKEYCNQLNEELCKYPHLARPEEEDATTSMMANFLSSAEAQGGLAGPVSNLLDQLGITLPENTSSKC
ncbi:hypothetical protein DIPPA_60024 [Diplonema papillatum]|nr:hypothetical protein DIPPA_60024 [Diplonema papillatum]